MSGTAPASGRPGRPARGEPLLQRAFRILGAFSDSDEALPLHVLASRAGYAEPARMTTVAAPILDRDGGSLGALSLLAPDDGRSRVPARVALRTASLAISR